ncbi:hypothetical protein GE09DRAFT_179769 [Coniochaeta sp. 2T2.1]|nr:hypothetical protein GE09DRAFT_179769 [Coniochaeta sp. 2T2.1]
MGRSDVRPDLDPEPANMPAMPRTPTPDFDHTDRARTRSLTPTSLAHGPPDLGTPNRTSEWQSPAASPLDRPAAVHGDDFHAGRSFAGASPISPSDDRGDIPIALAPGPQRFSMSSPPPPLPSAPIAGTAHIAEQYRPQQQYQQHEHQSQPQPYINQYEQDIYQPQAQPQQHTTFLHPQPSLPSRARMPFMPEPPISDHQEAIRFSHVRAHRPALKSSKHLPSPQPSPTVYNNDNNNNGDPFFPERSSRTRTLEKIPSFDAESGRSGSETKRKTLFQRALEGWWDLPGLLNRGDTVKGRRRVPERRLGKNEFF